MVWGSVSWILLSWHDHTTHAFADEAAVAAVLEQNALADRTAVYMLPTQAAWKSSAAQQGAADAWQASQRRLRQGPYAFAFVRKGVHESSLLRSRGYALMRSFAASLLISLLLGWTVGLSYLRRVLFCALAGGFAGLVADVPLMIWFEAPLGYTMTCIADHLCEWCLAGLPLAALVKGRSRG